MKTPLEYAQELYNAHGEAALRFFLKKGREGEWRKPGMSPSWLEQVITILVANQTTPILL